RVAGGVHGVADHNFIEAKGSQVFGFYNGGDTYGHLAWSQPTAWGSANFFFVEDNYVKQSNRGDLTDGDAGCRYVIRHNHLYNVDIQNHGTEGVARGGRAEEIYNNDFHNPGTQTVAGGTRSGGVRFYNNTWDGNLYGNFNLAV